MKTIPVTQTVEEIAVAARFDTLGREAWAVMDGAGIAVATEGPLPIFRSVGEANDYNVEHYQGRGTVAPVTMQPSLAQESQ